MTQDRRDPRRIGFAAAGLVGVYAVTIFLDVSLAFRLTFGGIFALAALGLAAFVPLPSWLERAERKRLAASWMVVEAVVIAGVITIVRLAIGHA